MSEKRPQGPNVKKLIVRRMSQLAIPAGGGFADGLAFLSSPESIAAGCRNATEWVFAAIDAVAAAPGCEWKGDEAIAGEILRQIDEKKKVIA